MPETLKEYLAGLKDDEAKAVFIWLDENPEVVIDMIEALCVCHKDAMAQWEIQGCHPGQTE